MGALILPVLLICVVVATAQEQTELVGTELERRSAAGGFEAAVRSAIGVDEIAWIAYQVPAAEGDHHVCCRSGNRSWSGCSLHDLETGSFFAREAQSVRLSERSGVWVLMRAEAGRIHRLRVFSSDCELDATDQVVVMLTDVSPAQSVAFLAAIAEQRGGPAALLAAGEVKRLTTEAVGAIGMHAAPGAIDVLIQIGRGDGPRRVRGQALFWLSQAAGARAVATLESVIETDPDVDIKKQALFALGQLPADRGVPLLIRIAGTHVSAAVRKQAIFWLGQSESPAAFDFIVRLLDSDEN